MDPGARRLSALSLLAVEGPDAGAFLQAQTMNDVRALAPGHWQWNGWLSPKGRVICLFALWRRGEQEFLLLLPDFPATELQPLLQRYVFRSKLRLRPVEDLVAAAAPPGSRGSTAGPRDRVQELPGGWRIDMGGDSLSRELWLLPPDAPGLLPADAATDAAWQVADLDLGLPRLDVGQREAWTPQMLSLQRLRAYSLGKGCYPGQEIVARTHYLGQAKRELARLSGSGLRAGAAVSAADGAALGTLVSASPDGSVALAVLSAARGEGPWLVEGTEARESALLGGLQRPV